VKVSQEYGAARTILVEAATTGHAAGATHHRALSTVVGEAVNMEPVEVDPWRHRGREVHTAEVCIPLSSTMVESGHGNMIAG
jgi:hypothetical protein